MNFLNLLLLFIATIFTLNTDILLENTKTDIERPKVKVKTEDTITDVKNSLYEYVKNSILNNKNSQIEDVKELPYLQEYVNLNKNKKKKGEEKIKYEEKLKKLKSLKQNLKVESFYKVLFNKTNDYYKKKNTNKQNQEWTENELESLNIIKNANNSKNILDKIDINMTQLGYFTNAMRLVYNEDDVEDIQNKIDSIKNLDIEELTKLYKTLKNYEISFINLFSDKPAKKRFNIGDDEYNAYIDFRGNLIKNTNHLNKKFLKVLLNPYTVIFLALHIGIPLTFSNSCPFFKIFYGGLFKKELYKNITEQPMKLAAILVCVIPMFIIYKILSNIYSYFNPGNFYKKISKKIYKIKTYIKTVEDIYNKIQLKEDTFIYFKSQLSKCRDLFIDKNNLTKDQIKMITLLNKIKPNWGYWRNFGTAHRVCTFLKLFDTHKNILIEPILEIANLERYIKIYTLINKEENNGNICTPEFSKTKLPFITLKDAWNPILDINKVVKNDISFGLETDKKVQLGILYGMNAGGKSTLSKTIGLNYIIGRCYGFCFARNAKMSYLKRLYITMDIKDDINNNYSKFMSEIIATDKIIQLAKELKDNEHCLLLSDELFSGTNPETANILSVNVIKFIITKKRLLTLFSTHNIEPTYIANNKNNVRNYIMDTNIKENKINYTYKIKEYNEKVENKNNDNKNTNSLIKHSMNIAEALIKDMHTRGLIKHPDIILGYSI